MGTLFSSPDNLRVPEGYALIEDSPKIVNLMEDKDVLSSFESQKINAMNICIIKGPVEADKFPRIIEDVCKGVNKGFIPKVKLFENQVNGLPATGDICHIFDQCENQNLKQGEFDQLLGICRCRVVQNGVRVYDYIIITISVTTKQDEQGKNLAVFLGLLGVVVGGVIATAGMNLPLGASVVSNAAVRGYSGYMEAKDTSITADAKEKIIALLMLVLRGKGHIQKLNGRLLAKFS